MPVLTEQGRLADHGGWRLTYHSRSKQENLHVEVPCRGEIRMLRQDAPDGRQWPSDNDQVLDDCWRDSDEALRIPHMEMTHPPSRSDASTRWGRRYNHLPNRSTIVPYDGAERPGWSLRPPHYTVM
jgi:hypothetical protein